MTRLTTILILFFLVSCKDSFNNDAQLNLQTVEALSGIELEKLLHIDIRKEFGEKYSGEYQFYSQSDTVKVLHGQFTVSYSESGFYSDPITNEDRDDMFWISKIKYSGQFKDGKKHGQFIEELLFDDGVDIYGEWTVIIEFENDICKSATYKGANGYVMPKTTTYTFTSIDSCSFDRVVDLAWDKWTKEYDEKKNAR
jgi:hypothetical protein